MNNPREQWQRIRERGMVRFIAMYGLGIAIVWIVVEFLLRYALDSPYLPVSIPGTGAKAIFGGLLGAIVIWYINEGRYRNSQ